MPLPPSPSSASEEQGPDSISRAPGIPAARDGPTYHGARRSCRPHVALRGDDRRFTRGQAGPPLPCPHAPETPAHPRTSAGRSLRCPATHGPHAGLPPADTHSGSRGRDRHLLLTPRPVLPLPVLSPPPSALEQPLPMVRGALCAGCHGRRTTWAGTVAAASLLQVRQCISTEKRLARMLGGSHPPPRGTRPEPGSAPLQSDGARGRVRLPACEPHLRST